MDSLPAVDQRLYQITDFVQVQHWRSIESGEPVQFWRNALYVRGTENGHVVLYTDGTTEEIPRRPNILRGIKVEEKPCEKNY